MVRGKRQTTPEGDSAQNKRIKRRYDVALSTPGAEIRLPSVPKVQISWRILSVILVGFLGYLLYTYSYSPAYRVTAAEVEGLQRISKHDINIVANVVEQPIFSIDPDEIERNLEEAFFDLSNVSVMVTAPSSVTVVVEERQPLIAWHQDGQMMWIDSSGMAFPPRGESGPPVTVEALDPLPTTSSAADLESQSEDDRSRFLPPQLLSAILAISIHVPPSTPLFYTEERGLGWQDTRGWDVFFGTDLKDIEMKLLVYDAIVDYVVKEGIQPELISVEFVHAPYYRLER
jgi:cell division protein FtsQ